jgi:hypothetical protein
MWSLLLAFSASATAGTLAFAPNAEATTEVRWADGGTIAVLERFPAAEGVVGSEVSEDGRWAFAWHQASGKPLRVSVYDLQSKQRVATFAPGFGGDLHFSATATLVLTHGCGTSCSMMTVFDLKGQKLLDVGGSLTDVSPNRRYALLYPDLNSDPCPVTLYDLGTGQRITEFGGTGSGELGVTDVKWAANGSSATLSVAPRVGAETKRYLRVSADGTSSWVEASTP